MNKKEMVKKFFINHKKTTFQGLEKSTGINKRYLKIIINQLLEENFIKNGKFTEIIDGYMYPDRPCFKLTNQKKYTQQSLNF